MSFFKKIIAITVLCFAHSYAQGACQGNQPVHNGFCSGKNQNLCQAHSGVCSWVGSQKVEVVVRTEKSCSAKPGQEAHENFCKPFNHQQCSTHSNLCSWGH